LKIDREREREGGSSAGLSSKERSWEQINAEMEMKGVAETNDGILRPAGKR